MIDERPRLFVAAWVRLPDETVAEAHQALASLGVQARPVAADRLHLTVLFLDRREAAVRACVSSIVEQTTIPSPSTLTFKGFDVFGGGRALTLMPTGEALEQLAHLRHALLDELALQGLATDTEREALHQQQSWRPHVTIGRVREPLDEAATQAVRALPAPPARAEVGPLDLVASTRTGGTHLYRSLCAGLPDR